MRGHFRRHSNRDYKASEITKKMLELPFFPRGLHSLILADPEEIKETLGTACWERPCCIFFACRKASTCLQVVVRSSRGLQGIVSAGCVPGDYRSFVFHVSWLPAAGIFQKPHEKWAELLCKLLSRGLRRLCVWLLILLGNFRVKNVITSEMPTTKAKGMSPLWMILCWWD